MKQTFKYILVFILFFTIFLGWHSILNDFLGTDPYYHAKHSYLMLENNDFTLVKPWLEFHFFKYAPTDLWWLYHIVQAGFIYLFGIIFGTKVLAATLASLIFSFIYYFLYKFKVSNAFVWTFIAFLSSSQFTTRLLLERPFVLAIFFSLVCLYLILQKRYLKLFFIMIIYTLSYELSILVLLISFFVYLAEYYFKKKIDLKILISILGGFLVGVLLHPQSLNYLYNIFVVFWQIFFLKIIGVDLKIGSELQTQSFINFIDSNLILLSFYLVACALFIKKFLEKTVNYKITSLFLLSIFWFSVSAFISRGVEYWAPFGFLFIVLIITEVRKSGEFELVKKFIKEKTYLGLISFFIISVFITFSFYNIFPFFGFLEGVNRNNKNFYYEDINNWLKENTEEGEIVFYPIWSMFPRMFFYNDYNHYITGMDPTLLYEYDKKTYWIWANLSYNGEYCENERLCWQLSPKKRIVNIREAFHRLNVKTIVVPKKEKNRLYRVLNTMDKDFRQVYENKGLVIFTIIN